MVSSKAGLQRLFPLRVLPPLFCFNQDGDLERVILRNGNVASAHDWRTVLLLVIERYSHLDIRKYFRGDAVFVIPKLYEFLETECFAYAHPPARQRRTLSPVRPSDEASGGAATSPAHRVLGPLALSGGKLEQASHGRGQGTMAS